MLICLCGDLEEKLKIINKLTNEYKDKLLIVNYYNYLSNEKKSNEQLKYQLLNNCNTYNQVQLVQFLLEEQTHKNTNELIKNIIKNNKNKIILLISNNITKDIDKTPFFNNANLKILAISKEKLNNFNYFLKYNSIYNNDSFDIIIDTSKLIDIKTIIKSKK